MREHTFKVIKCFEYSHTANNAKVIIWTNSTNLNLHSLLLSWFSDLFKILPIRNISWIISASVIVSEQYLLGKLDVSTACQIQYILDPL